VNPAAQGVLTGVITPPVTLVITSFNRFDLLQQTLDSFFAHNDYPLARAIVIEDSQNREFFDVIGNYRGLGVEPMFNEKRLGQHRSIDRAYATVDTEYVFHCEDDYLFGRPGIIRESIDILERDPDVLMVLALRKQDLPYYLRSVPLRMAGATRYRKVGPHFHHIWYTFSFNAGLRRISDYRLLPGGYGAFPDEGEISRFYKRLGRTMAILPDGMARHVGVDRRTQAAVKRFDPWHLIENTRRSLARRRRHYLRLIGIGDGSE
jgi:hypothetical protein